MRQKARYTFLLASVLLGAALPQRALAQSPAEESQAESEPVEVSLGAGFIASPRPYVGTEARIFPIPVLNLRYKRAFVQGIRFGYELVQRGRLTASVLTQVAFAGLEPDDSPFLEGMETRRKSLDAGVEVLYRGRPVGFRATLLSDVLGRSRGQVASVAAVTGAPLGKVLVLVGAGPTWHSQRRTDYYYGVRVDEERPGRPAYAADATVNFELDVAVFFTPNDRWSLFLLARRDAFGSSIENSPIVGRKTAIGVVTALTYNF